MHDVLKRMAEFKAREDGGLRAQSTTPKIKHERKLGKYGLRKNDPNYGRVLYALNEDYRLHVKESNERNKESKKAHRRNSVLCTNINGEQVIIHVDKRPWPGHCELCNHEDRIIFYHHWDDKDMSKGIWLCYLCHIFAEIADIEGKFEKYTTLKQKIIDTNTQ